MAAVIEHDYPDASALDTPEPIITREFGPDNLRAVLYPELNVVSQMRQLYETEPLEELSASIDLHGLMHQLTVAELTPEQCVDYLEGVNKVWKSDHGIDELAVNQAGNYYIVIAGHRRHLAIGKLIEDHGWEPDGIAIISNVHEDILAFEALKLQLSENVMAQPKPYEFAYAVRELYEVGLLEGRFSSVAAFARELEFKEDKVRNAVRYCMLPGRVRQLVERSSLSYSASLELVPLLQAYLEREDPSDVIDEEVFTVAVKGMLNNWNQAETRKMVIARISALRDGQADLQDLFEATFEEESRRRILQAQAERRSVIKEFSTNALGGLSHLLRLSEEGILGKRDIALDVEQVKMHMQFWTSTLKRILETSGITDTEIQAHLAQLDETTELLPGQETIL